MMGLPPPDSQTIWSVVITLLSAPVIWLWRKIKFLEERMVSKEEFEDRLDELEKANCLRTQNIRNDIARVEGQITMLIQHLINTNKSP